MQEDITSDNKEEALEQPGLEKQQTGAEADIGSPILSMGDIPKPDSPNFQIQKITIESPGKQAQYQMPLISAIKYSTLEPKNNNDIVKHVPPK